MELRNPEIKRLNCHVTEYISKHNFMRSQSEHLFSKLKSFSSSDIGSHQIEIGFGGFVKKLYTCNLCVKNFSNKEILRNKEKLSKRKQERRKKGECHSIMTWAISFTFRSKDINQSTNLLNLTLVII